MVDERSYGPADAESLRVYVVENFLNGLDKTFRDIVGQNPLLNMMSIKTDLGVDNSVPIVLSPAAGIAGNLKDAFAAASSSQHSKFKITGKNAYLTARWSRRDVRRMKDNALAIANAADTETQTAKERFKNELSQSLFGGPGGSIGRIHHVGTGASKDLIVPTDVARRLAPGDHLRFSQNDGTSESHTLRSGGTSNTEFNWLHVIAIEYLIPEGTYKGFAKLSCTEVVNSAAGMSGLTSNDYIFLPGSFQKARSGLRGWLPQILNAGNSVFNQVDRLAVDSRIAGGVRVDGAKDSPTDALENLVFETQRYSVGTNRTLVCSLEAYKSISRGLDTKRTVELRNEKGEVGLSGVEFSPGIPLVWDRFCDNDLAYLLSLDDWSIRCTDALIHHIPNDAGGEMHFLGAGDPYDDGYAVILNSDCDFACKAPGRSGVAYNLNVAAAA